MIKKAESTSGSLSVIERLQQQLKQPNQPAINWLVIAHDDSRMLDQLRSAVGQSGMVVVALPQSLWGGEYESLQEIAQWATSQLQLKGILLVGHSQSGICENTVQVVTGPANDEDSKARPMNRVSSLFSRVQEAQARVASCERHFRNHLEQLIQLAGGPVDSSSAEVELRGLFYRAESGVFCAYDVVNGNFRPLVSHSTVG